MRQELGARHMQQRLPAALSPNVMMLPLCQQVSMHMLPEELQRNAVDLPLLKGQMADQTHPTKFPTAELEPVCVR